MITLSRADNSVVARWWWTIDRLQLLSLIALMTIGFILTWAASPAVAERLGLDSFYFVKRQAVFLSVGLFVMLSISLFTIQSARRFAVLLLPASLMLIVATLVIGPEIKGATRWLPAGPVSLQPSEILKPAFAVTCAWLLGVGIRNPAFPAKRLTLVLLLGCMALLAAQPDIGQAMLLGLIWTAELMLVGLPLAWFAMVIAAAIAALTLSYLTFPHVAARIDRFIDPASGDTYQIDRAMEAFRTGGLFGAGPGEGAVKWVLPDAHTDFIFAVAGEEFGLLACLVFVAMIAAIALRALARLAQEQDPFLIFAVGGLVTLFVGQALINISVNLAIIPPKGMTLPMVSYGGSSMVAMTVAMGLMLAFGRGEENRHLPSGEGR